MTAPKKKILYVEDNADNQFLIGYYVKSEPYDLHFASTGEEALAKVREQSFDLFLVDLNLSDSISGTDVIAAIHKSDQNKDKPVVLITAFTQSDRDNSGIDVKVNKTVTKPVRKAEFMNILSELCPV